MAGIILAIKDEIKAEHPENALELIQKYHVVANNDKELYFFVQIPQKNLPIPSTATSWNNTTFWAAARLTRSIKCNW
ncbi:MAG: hypothetical protein IJU23_03865 [Proteobacteria bacterium]|nr:hypothetical protein [Pseudomonadota bacterium]